MELLDGNRIGQICPRAANSMVFINGHIASVIKAGVCRLENL
jgi:hypothetical protein